MQHFARYPNSDNLVKIVGFIPDRLCTESYESVQPPQSDNAGGVYY